MGLFCVWVRGNQVYEDLAEAVLVMQPTQQPVTCELKETKGSGRTRPKSEVGVIPRRGSSLKSAKRTWENDEELNLNDDKFDSFEKNRVNWVEQ